MTFGEKLKNARKESGLSQEQLAEKMSVSRSAIAKWESDKGMPDVTNLKVMSSLLNVSVDYLLDDDEQISFNEIKEAINLDDYKKEGARRDRKDAVCYEKHKDADTIYALISKRKMSKTEALIDFFVQPGVVEVLDRVKEIAGFYLVEDGSTSAAGKAYLHIPSDEVAGAQKLRIIFGESPDGVVSPFEETEEGAIYNLAGQRLNKLQKGINIKDGKKVIVK